MGNSLNTNSSALMPLAMFDGGVSLEKACCSCRKEEHRCEDQNTTEPQKRRGVRSLSFIAARRSAPYSSRIGIEGFTPTSPLSSDDPGCCLGIPACKNSDPEPLTSWTIKEQQILIDSLNEHPQARANESYRQRLMERVQSVDLPNKSLDEIRKCYAHLLDIRLAVVRDSRFSQPTRLRQGGGAVIFET
jgi:hypothetical protein